MTSRNMKSRASRWGQGVQAALQDGYQLAALQVTRVFHLYLPRVAVEHVHDLVLE